MGQLMLIFFKRAYLGNEKSYNVWVALYRSKMNEVLFLPVGRAVSPSEANSQLFLDNLCRSNYFKYYGFYKKFSTINDVFCFLKKVLHTYFRTFVFIKKKKNFYRL